MYLSDEYLRNLLLVALWLTICVDILFVISLRVLCFVYAFVRNSFLGIKHDG